MTVSPTEGKPMTVSELYDKLYYLRVKHGSQLLLSEVCVMDINDPAYSENLCAKIKLVDWYDGVLYIKTEL